RFSSPPAGAEALCVEHTVMQMPKGPYREVLDWLVEQIERLDAHREQLEAEAARGELDAQTLSARQTAIAQAHDWLADQLRQALLVRGMHLAACSRSLIARPDRSAAVAAAARPALAQARAVRKRRAPWRSPGSQALRGGVGLACGHGTPSTPCRSRCS